MAHGTAITLAALFLVLLVTVPALAARAPRPDPGPEPGPDPKGGPPPGDRPTADTASAGAPAG
jgi:hypothetical protein